LSRILRNQRNVSSTCLRRSWEELTCCLIAGISTRLEACLGLALRSATNRGYWLPVFTTHSTKLVWDFWVLPDCILSWAATARRYSLDVRPFRTMGRPSIHRKDLCLTASCGSSADTIATRKSTFWSCKRTCKTVKYALNDLRSRTVGLRGVMRQSSAST
jgi:hypothetical protein